MTASNGDPPTGSNAAPAPLVLLRFTLTGTYYAAPADYPTGEPAAMAAEDLEAVTAAADCWGVLDPVALVGAVRTTCGDLDHVTAAITPDTPNSSEAVEEEAVVVLLSASSAAQVRAALAVIADGGPVDGRADEPDPRALASAALAVLARASTTTPPTRPDDQRQDQRRG
jgi:hypothetical protein